MATDAQMNQLQGLYIAYFGRPNDAAGVSYWTAEIDGGATIDQIADRMMESDEFTATSRDLSDVVSAAYTNALGRTAGAEEVAFWVGQIEAGNQTVASLLEAFRSTDDATDSQTLENKITVAKAYTDAAVAGANFDTAASVALLAGVDATQASVDAALEEIGAEAPVDNAELNEALGDLQAAQQAVADFLEEAEENELVEPAAGADTRAQIESAHTQTVGALALEVAAANSANTNFAKVSSSVREAMITETEQALAKNISDARADVAKVQGLEKAINAVVSAQNALETAEEAQELTEADAAGAVAKFNALPTTSAVTTYTPTTVAGGNVVLIGGDRAIGLTAEGALRIEPAFQSIPGITDLFNAVQADVNALKAIDNAENNLEAAQQTVLELESGEAMKASEDFNALVQAYETAYDAYDAAEVTTATALEAAWTDLLAGFSETAAPTVADTDGDGLADDIISSSAAITSAISAEQDALSGAVDAPLASALMEALANQEAFAEALQDYRTTSELVQGLNGLDDAVEAAVEAIEALDYVVDTDNVGSADNDVFIFNDANATISGFGVQGDDILFIGAGFNRVNVEAGVDIAATKQGDVGALEVFFQQVGANTVIYIESETYAGNSTVGFEGNFITLTGVNAADLQLSAEGFVTLA